MTVFSTLNYAVSDGVATITLDRPPLNLIDLESTHEYLAALDRADADRSVKVIVLNGAGKGLSGGVDIKFMRDFDDSHMAEFVQLFYVEQVRRVRALTKPIIAAVHGYAREGACTMAFTCDMVIAADDATFGYPGVPNLAAPPGMHVWHLQQLMGRMKAAELILTGDPISAADADRYGLVTRVVPGAELVSVTQKLAMRLAEMSPHALKVTRELMYQMESMDFKDVPEVAAKAISDAFASPDSREARQAFLEKRRPVWRDA
ncbi:MAG: enoyl-CoA hydratase/isomerase family protein [Pseudomonadota bacterium]